MTARQQFIDAYKHEHATTMRVLRAFPIDRSELRPHPRCKNARELAWAFVGEQGLCQLALTTGFDWSQPPALPPVPATIVEAIDTFEAGRDPLLDLVAGREDDLNALIQFPTAPFTLGQMTLAQLLWMMLCDQIHHRGQFSVYLRMADGKVPSIYGPTADEAWT